MKVYEEKHKLKLPKSHGRSVGLHISEVIRDFALNAKVLDRKWISELAIEEQNTNMMQMGLAWEDYLAAHQHPEIEYHPGELMGEIDDLCTCGHDLDTHDHGECLVRGCDCDGWHPVPIYMSPDGVSMIDPEDYAELFRVCDHFLHEFKLTKKSSRNFLRALIMQEKKVKMWLWQIACYCYALRTLFAKLHVMFINGNYEQTGDGAMPQYKIFRLEFTQADLDSTWDLMRNHARAMYLRGR